VDGRARFGSAGLDVYIGSACQMKESLSRPVALSRQNQTATALKHTSIVEHSNGLCAPTFSLAFGFGLDTLRKAEKAFLTVRAR
jgi:hypothetical protein